jgi:hypothetical protein
MPAYKQTSNKIKEVKRLKIGKLIKYENITNIIYG